MAKLFRCDFECTTGVTSETDSRVWAWGVVEIDGLFNKTEIGKDIDSFMEWVEREKPIGYIHNIRYDGTFIISWLENNGFSWSDKGEEGTYNAFINSSGVMYSISITYPTRTKKTRKTARFFDSHKKIPMSVAQIAKSFGLSYEKGEIDYHKYRPVGYEMDKNELDYLLRDIKIVAEAIYVQVVEGGLDKMTIGADALNMFKDTLLERRECVNLKGKKNAKNKAFRHFFPVLDYDRVDTYIREAYKGGYTYVNERYEGKTIGEGMVYDINSLYSYVMSDKMLPYGVPLSYEGEYKEDKRYPLWVGKISFAFDLNEGYLPIIQIKGKTRYADNVYVKSSDDEVITLTVTSVDWELYNKHYHIYDVTFHGGFKFKARNDLFKAYVDYWVKEKQKAQSEDNLGMYTICKMMLNNLYGKFSTNAKRTPKIPSLDEKTGVVVYEFGDTEIGEPVYTPAGAFITAYARNITISAAQSVGNRFVYSDTDSLHVLGRSTPKILEHVIHHSKLGYWDLETHFTSARYLRQKTYMYVKCMKWDEDKQKQVPANFTNYTISKMEIKCAGMPEVIKKYVTYNNFQYGFKFKGDASKGINGKVKPVNVRGGQILVDVPFSIQKPMFLNDYSMDMIQDIA